MKTKDLIKLLQEADPTGELDCVVGNEDIFDVWVEPAYWDGCKQLLVRDTSLKGYNIVGAEYRSDGEKVQIQTMNIMEAMLDNPDLPVTVVDNFVDKHMQATVDAWRTEIREIKKKVEDWKNATPKKSTKK